MKNLITLMALGLLLLCGCLPNPYEQCVGRVGDDMRLCIAQADATMAWRRGVGDSLRNWGMATTIQSQQAPQQTTCTVVGNVVHCF